MAPILEVQGLIKRFGGIVATDNANLSIMPGEIHALIGPNGAGKTTLICQLAGTLQADAGKIIFNHVEISRMPMHTRVLRGLARSYQVTNIFRKLSVLENITLAVQARNGSSFRFFRSLQRETELFDEARDIIGTIGLMECEHRQVNALSYGEQRRVEIGIALATKPKLLLLDEPLAGMGSSDAGQMVTLIESLKNQVSILLVEHDMNAVFRLADRISVLVYGHVIATGTPDEIRSNAAVRHAYLGEEATH